MSDIEKRYPQRIACIIMKNSAQDGMYGFVSYQGSELPQDPKVRNLIRRHAMKHTAAVRKRNGGYARLNTRQLPVRIIESDQQDGNSKAYVIGGSPNTMLYRYPKEDEEIAQGKVEAAGMLTNRSTSICCTPINPLLNAISQNYYLLHLAAPQTVLHVGISTVSFFKSNFSCIGKTLCNIEARRLFSYIPSRYGHVSTITYATDCLISKLKQTLGRRDSGSADRDLSTLRLYSKALRSLQEAIDDQKLRVTAETLCAVELLAICEVSHPSFEQAFRRSF